MASGSRHPTPSRPDTGWTELQGGRWDAARSIFEGLVRSEETAEAYEGLSWAAWWLDDAEAVFEARERAYHLYEAGGEVESAARMATWLASDELDFHGAFAVAGGWLARARRLLEPLAPGPEHGWLAFLEGYIAHARGETAKAVECARRSADLGRRFAVQDLEMLGLALEGATLVAAARVEEGMGCLDEATAIAMQDKASVPISGAWACCFLVTACTAVRDYDRAFEWCDRIAQFAERYGSRYMLAFCRAEYGTVHLWRGRWDEAEAMLQASIEDFGRSRPAMVGGPLAGLAELRRRQGRDREAVELLDRAAPSSAVQLCRARLALDRGDPGLAAELTERSLRQLPADRRLDRAPALELLARARIALGDLEEASAALDALRAIERTTRTDALLASVEFTEGVLAASGGDHDRARPLLEDATDRFERSGGPFEAAQARIELATTLLALGRREEADREATGALDALLGLGAEGDAERARRLRMAAAGSDQREDALHRLTPREREVLRHLTEGLTNRQIAERLVVSEHTVHRHVTNLLRKLELPSRTAAAALAVRVGLLHDPPP